MLMVSKSGKSCTVYCSCGCDNGVVLRGERDDFGYEISLVSDTFFLAQESGWVRFKEKCKRIWRILRNKEHHYFDICLDDYEIEEFKEFVAKI